MFRQLRMRYVLMFVVMGTLGIPAATASEIVNFADAELETAVRDELGIPKPTPITDTDMEDLECLEVFNENIFNLAGLEYGTNLTYLGLGMTQISNISVVSRLTNLTELNLTWNQISDISAVSSLTNLNGLYLGMNQVDNISAVSGLTSLTKLWLDHNQISSISAVSRMTNLVQLILGNNQIDTIDLSNSDLSSLEEFHIDDNPLKNVLLTNATISQSVFDALMDGGIFTGIAELGGVLNLDMSGVDLPTHPICRRCTRWTILKRCCWPGRVILTAVKWFP